ncbi:unnamed protein product [Auanema sp. JU1783]|nr:unnamed protein product [Auanema sp. JU1783]
MSNFGRALGYNIAGQMISRVLSFGISMYLLRVVDNDILGLVNVRLMLLYDTILFLTREPIRKANIADSSISQFVNVVWLSPLICFLISLVCMGLWAIGTSSSVPLWIFLCFPVSSMIESFAEPFVVYSLRFSIGSHFAISQALLVVLKRFVAFALIIFTSNTVYHLDIFAISQIIASLLYLFYNVFKFYQYSKKNLPELAQFQSFRSFFPTPKDGLNKEMLKSVGSLFSHSILKQLLTSGSSYVMTFTDLLSLKNQAVFDGVERLASLVARIVLAPLEENCYAEFSNHINKQSAVFKQNTDAHDSLAKKFGTILHITLVIGLVVSVFGVPYSKLAVWLYGGSLLADNGGAVLLSLYCFYILIIAINGITECFAMASMNNSQVVSHGGFLFLSATAHIGLNVILCYKFHAAGFILANSVNMIIRICYSWRHISNYLGQSTPSIFDDILPKSDVFIFLFFSFFATMFSFVIFGTAQGLSHLLAHVAVGLVMILLLVCISLWTIASDCSVPLWILLCFPCSSMIESFAEPFVVYSIRFSIGNHFAVSQALLVILKRLVAFGLITLTETNAYHLDILAISQILASLLYLFFNVSKFYYYTKQNLPELAQFQSFRSFFPTPKDGLNGEFCSRIINEYPKVLSHFLISNGSNFVMTFTNFVSLEEIGLYDVVERLGGFFCRILFAPLEDICYGWTQKKEGKISKNLSQMLPAIIRLSIYFGVVAGSLGLLLSKLLLSASRLDFTTHESLILSFYSLFIATTAVSTTLDYATKYSTADKNPNFNMMIIIIHVALNVILCYKFHAAGFILANSVNMIIRICYR